VLAGWQRLLGQYETVHPWLQIDVLGAGQPTIDEQVQAGAGRHRRLHLRGDRKAVAFVQERRCIQLAYEHFGAAFARQGDGQELHPSGLGQRGGLVRVVLILLAI